ncbi:hypothetical protein HP10700_05869, partial [Helicobacter pylori 10700]
CNANKNLRSNNSIPQKGYPSHYKGIVLIIKSALERFMKAF